MKLQLALDRLTREECKNILADTSEFVDWIEVGTGVIKEYGMGIIKEIRNSYPDKVIVADMKTCDAASHETKQALKAGADITTVMAFSDDNSIRSALDTAKEEGGEIMIDLLNSPEKRIAELHQLGVTIVSLHIGKDQQADKNLNAKLFEPLKPFPEMRVAVAGGITKENIPILRLYKPETVIVGSSITKNKDPKKAAKDMKEAL